MPGVGRRLARPRVSGQQPLAHTFECSHICAVPINSGTCSRPAPQLPLEDRSMSRAGVPFPAQLLLPETFEAHWTVSEIIPAMPLAPVALPVTVMV